MIKQSELKRLLNQRPPDVIEEISPDDVMHDDGDLHPLYFHGAQRALRNCRLALLSAMREDVRSVLDLPSGHGRVLRMLKAAFPDARLTACDIDRDAVDFCARVFGATPVYSVPDPAQIEIDDSFDLIYCGSLLTHVDSERWTGFLALFERLLADDGVLLFTTGGRSFAEQMRSRKRMFGLPEDGIRGILADYEREGHGYREWPHAESYGMAMATPWWVCRKLEEFPALRLLYVTEQAPQDVFACIKGPVSESAKVSR